MTRIKSIEKRTGHPWLSMPLVPGSFMFLYPSKTCAWSRTIVWKSTNKDVNAERNVSYFRNNFKMFFGATVEGTINTRRTYLKVCGRFTQHHDADSIIERFDIQDAIVTPEPRYNVAPQQNIPVILAPQNTRVLSAFRWGLVPGWAKDAAIGQKMINARSETITEKPSFRTALTRRRCLIPADGFYEWERHADGTRHPVHFRLQSGGPFAFAGLWEEWHAPGSEEMLRTCTILTTSANETVGRVHDRMPVMLARDAEEIWLDMSVRDTDLLRSFCVPYPDSEMEAFPVSRRVNSPVNEGPELVASFVPDDSRLPLQFGFRD